MFNFFCKILQHPKINLGSAPGINAANNTKMNHIMVKITSPLQVNSWNKQNPALKKHVPSYTREGTKKGA